MGMLSIGYCINIIVELKVTLNECASINLYIWFPPRQSLITIGWNALFTSSSHPLLLSLLCTLCTRVLASKLTCAHQKQVAINN